MQKAASPRCSQSAGRMPDERPAQFELLSVVDEEDEEDEDAGGRRRAARPKGVKS